ncbi:MAG: acyltransferase [Rubrivivax sp.]|jgi:acetyltransferase-like isoleucine patch superfamily enzyme
MRAVFNRVWRALFAPRMLYGWRRGDGVWLPHTRISSATRIEAPAALAVEDHVYIGPFNLLDASGGLHIGEGVQVTTHCALLSHSSHQALRLAGRQYFGLAQPPGFRLAATHVGPYCFIGPHSVLAPGTRLGRGVLVKAYSYVSGEVPDFAIVAGQPAVVVGDTREADASFLADHPEWREAYTAWAGAGGRWPAA